MTEPQVAAEAWATEGRRIAGSLDGCTAAVIVGEDPVALAAVVLALTKATASLRPVAIADLIGLAPAFALSDDLPGLTDVFSSGAPVSGIARPLETIEQAFVMPIGTGDPLARGALALDARWPKLIAGFREMDALLLLVATPSAPGLSGLIAQTEGVVAVDLPPVLIRSWPLIATVDRPEPELPPIAPIPEGSARPPRRARRTPRAALLVLLVVAVAAGAIQGLPWAMARWGAAPAPATTTVAPEQRTPPPSAVDAEDLAGAPTTAPPDTLTLLGPVNPEDSLLASPFAVQLIAANTLSGANSRFASASTRLPATTVSPVVMGRTGRVWYRASVGAWRDRAAAERWLNEERARGVIGAEAGRVVNAPFALLLAEGRSQPDAAAIVAQWRARGVIAYPLEQQDGSVRIFAGAFETMGEAGLLAATVRDAGETPMLAIRTGRTF